MIGSKCILLSISFLASFKPLQCMDIETGLMPSFEKIKWDLQLAAAGLGKVKTLAAHCRKYGYNGDLIHIVKYPEIIGTGFIIENAQPSMWWGYWYDDSCAKENRIFIDHNNLKYEAKIKNGADTIPNILSSSFFAAESKNTMDHYLALLWKVTLQIKVDPKHGRCWVRPAEKKSYISVLCLAEVKKQGNIFDLDQNKVEVK